MPITCQEFLNVPILQTENRLFFFNVEQLMIQAFSYMRAPTQFITTFICHPTHLAFAHINIFQNELFSF